MQVNKSILALVTVLLFCGQLQAREFSVIAHRGAPGYLPEHTLPSLVLAYSQGANFIEQDLVVTKDKQLIVLHDIHLETVTNVEQVFPDRKRGDGRYYALDFTLAELQSLTVHERTTENGKMVFTNRFKAHQPFKITTFEQQIETINELNRQFSKQVGIYTEIKSPAWHRAQGVDISKLVLAVVRRYQLDKPDSLAYLQCFDYKELKRIRMELGAKIKLVQLIGENEWQESDSDYDWLQTPNGLQDVARFAQGIGPWLPQVLDQESLKPTALTATAHKLGLVVHPYTFRKDQLPDNLSTDRLLHALKDEAKVDGVFTDFTDVVVSYLQAQ